MELLWYLCGFCSGLLVLAVYVKEKPAVIQCFGGATALSYLALIIKTFCK